MLFIITSVMKISQISSFLKTPYRCLKVVVLTLLLYSKCDILLLISIPFITTYLNMYVQRIFNTERDNILYCLCFKALYDYLSFFVQSRISYRQCRTISDKLILQLNMAKLKSGVPLPGINQKQHKDLTDESYKLRDFMFVLPMLWSSCVSFGVSIYNMKIESEYPIRLLFCSFCITMCIMLTYLTDVSVYEKTKPDSKKITKFGDSNYVKMKMSMGCTIDADFEPNKKLKMDKQQNIQKYVICMVNLIVTYISLSGNDISQINAFGHISWMLGSLADNLKSFQYYNFVSDFMKLYKTLEKHSLKAEGITILGNIDKVDFVNASFGYYLNDLTVGSEYITKIKNLTYSFKRGMFYYLEAPNGIGKSTLLKMFLSNLYSGDIFFGAINRIHLSFEAIMSSVFHIVQASEYTPKFSTDEVKAYKGRDFGLEERLGLKDLLDKDTVEMSGGQKKRMFIYIVLTSDAPILLLDEILSELSTEETPEVPEGGGWLGRVINTLVEWKGRQNKIMILVGHGLLKVIPDKKDIIKLKIFNQDNQTELVESILVDCHDGLDGLDCLDC